jgi:hypothetical protein
VKCAIFKGSKSVIVFSEERGMRCADRMPGIAAQLLVFGPVH